MPSPSDDAWHGASGAPRALVVMGVAGSGKTTVSRLAAERLGWAFVEADELHTPASRERMRAGAPLTDADREPWLGRVRQRMEQQMDEGRSVVVACSALRRSYRDALHVAGYPVRFVWLDVSEGELRRRLEARKGHFAGRALLGSQLITLEVPARDEATRVAGEREIPEVVAAVVAAAE
jgi:gluconokinase